MLTDRQHHRGSAGLSAAHLAEQAGNRRHVAVFHGGPYRRRVAQGELTQLLHGRQVGAGRFFQQQWQGPGRGDLQQLLGMAMVGAGDDQRIKPGVLQQCCERLQLVCGRRQGLAERAHARIGLKDGGHLNVWEQSHIAQVFLPHHAAAQQPVMFFAHAAPSLLSAL